MTDKRRVRRFVSYAMRGVEIDNGEAVGSPVLTEDSSFKVASRDTKLAAKLSDLRARRGEARAAAAAKPVAGRGANQTKSASAPEASRAIAARRRAFAGHD